MAWIRFLQKCPIRLTSFILSLLLPCYFLLRSSHIKKVSLQLKKCFPALTIRSYYHRRLYLYLMNIQLHGRPLNKSKIQFLQKENYDQALTQNRPIILLGLHAGLFEFLHKAPAKPLNKDFYILTAKAFADPLSTYMRNGREIEGKKILWNTGETWRLRKVLRTNSILALMIDQFPSQSNENLKLWNCLSLPCSTHLLQLCLQYKALLIPISTYLDPQNQPILKFHSAFSLADASSESLIKFMQAFLEEAIAKAPLDWNWSYPKLKIYSGA